MDGDLRGPRARRPVRRDRVEQTAYRVEHVTRHVRQDARPAHAVDGRRGFGQRPVRRVGPTDFVRLETFWTGTVGFHAVARASEVVRRPQHALV